MSELPRNEESLLREARDMKFDPGRSILVPGRIPEKREIPKERAPWFTRFEKEEHFVLKGVIFQVKDIGDSRLILKPVLLKAGQSVEVRMKGVVGK